MLKFGVAGLTAMLTREALAQTAPASPPAPAAPAGAGPAASPAAAPKPVFDPANVVEYARALSKKPYRAPSADLPDAFSNLSYEQFVGIKHQPGTAIWAHEALGYAIEPLHRGFVFTTPMELNVVENGAVRRLPYTPTAFDFGSVKPPAEPKDIGFSGFRVLRKREGQPDVGVATFQGASFFRAIAIGEIYGPSARGLSIRTADPKGEEFPLFRAVWIEQPTLAADALVIHAVLDSESVSGAYRFTLRAGEATIIDTECTLFPRVALDHIGVATMMATHVAGPLDHRLNDDVRPGIFDVAGLQILNGRDEWLWRPVSNRETLQLSAFVDENPRGFGFLQRDRQFARFLDDDNHWEMRPSLWIEPIGDWGAGTVVLVEIPSDSEVNQNIIAYWRPAAPLAAGSEVQYAYRQFWCWTPPDRPSNAVVTLSRGGRPGGAPANTRRRRFMVDFTGDTIAAQQQSSDIVPALAAAPGNISAVRTFMNRDRKTYRVLFDVDPGSDASSELRLQLEVQGKPISETWLYRWTP